MDTRSLALHGLALSLVVPLLAGAGCLARSDPGDGQSEAVGSAPQADVLTVAPPGPGYYPTCINWGNYTFNNPGWPRHVRGSCEAIPGGVAYTFQDALAQCPGGVKYYGYDCTDLVDVRPAYTWTSYVGCCMPTCDQSITLETRYYAGSPPTSTQQGTNIYYSLPTGVAGYGTAQLQDTSSFSNHTSLINGATADIAYHLQVVLEVGAADAGTWGFRLAADFGLGGALLIDDAAPSVAPGQQSSLWSPNLGVDGLNNCSQDWLTASNVLQGTYTFAEGQHFVDVYGFENGDDCQNGPDQMELEYLAPTSSAWAPFHLCSP
jgi:hypothetical protein